MRELPSPTRYLIAGGVLAAIEVGMVVLTRRALFLSAMELARYALLAFTALPALCALLGVATELGLHRLQPAGRSPREFVRRLRLVVFAASVPLCAWLFWSLSAGRRVRDLPGRAVIVAVAALLASWALALIAGHLARAKQRVSRAVTATLAPVYASLLFAIVGIAIGVDMHVLTRLYPAFHAGLGVLAIVGALSAAAFLPPTPGAASAARAQLVAWAAALLCVACGALAARALATAPNARFAIAQSAPLSARLLPSRRAPRAAALPSAQLATRAAAPAQPGIDLRGSDVLLITVDALRADRLRAYGGHGLTPALDALAEQSVVFEHAYTPTPHTSYALSSLMTAKFMQPLLSLSEIKDDHPTLPQLLRNHGYRTAAFYPPAIFFVDGERFEHLKNEQLGFEYVKAMYAPAEERVAQLEQYLREVTPGHPLLVWMHLFEPHEPYDPPAAFARGDTPVERYDGEVAAADAAVGQLVSVFRRARPGATVIVSADHGEEFGDHGGHHHGTALYEEHVHVPLLWSSPGRAPAHHVSAPIEILDLTTTLLAALHIPREARMRGDDLGALLAGATNASELRAFSSIDGARMFTDGVRKLICTDDECRLFDLAKDPGERRDVSEEQPEAAARLRGELDEFVASLPRVEALAMSGGGAWPNALARARLGDVAAGPALVPLLSSPRPDVRAAAARALGELGSAFAREALTGLHANDADDSVRAEAAIAALRLGQADAREAVAALLPVSAVAGTDAIARAGVSERDRRAALALALQGDTRGDAILIGVALDAKLEELERVAAVRALAVSGGADTSLALLPLLEHVRLRREVADALGRLNDRRACPALEHALVNERYPEARRAEIRALFALGAHAPAVAAAKRFLGTDSSFPDALALLAESKALASAGGADLRTERSARRGAWQCEVRGCRPLAKAAIALRAAPKGAARVIVRAHVEGTSRLLRIGSQTQYLNAGGNEVALVLPRARGAVLGVSADEGVWLEAFAAVAPSEDVPPPAPEPWVAQGANADTSSPEARTPPSRQ